MDVSIVIVSYNTSELTLQTIASIYEKTNGIAFEIIVVDNASSDDTLLQINERFPNVKVVASRENLGFGRANNLGAKHAKGKYLLLLNPDTKLINNAIRIMFDYIERSSNVGICGGNLYDADGKPTHSYSNVMPSIKMELFSFLGSKISKILGFEQFNKTDKPKKVAYITGADLMISKQVFDIVKGFDPDFFMYFEETELTHRVRKMGYSVVNVPAAKIIHFEGKSFSVNERRYKMIFHGRRLFYQKCHTAVHALCADLILCCTGYSRIVCYSLVGNTTMKNIWKSYMRVYFETRIS